jgi:hypothetical protein
VDTKLEHAFVGPVRAEAAASDVRAFLEPDDGPVLEAALVLDCDLPGQPLDDGFARQRAVRVEIPRHGGVSPEPHRQVNVLRTPGPEAEAGGGEEVGGGRHTRMHADRRRGIKTNLTAPVPPRQIKFVGTPRPELLDHLIVMGERPLLRAVRDYVAYYNGDRPHMSLGGDAPVTRPVEPPTRGKVVTIPRVGGPLHHRYARAA